MSWRVVQKPRFRYRGLSTVKYNVFFLEKGMVDLKLKLNPFLCMKRGDMIFLNLTHSKVKGGGSGIYNAVDISCL